MENKWYYKFLISLIFVPLSASSLALNTPKTQNSAVLGVSGDNIPVSGQPLQNRADSAQKRPIPPEDTKIVPLKELDNWLNKLAECESGRRTDIKVRDTNGLYSYSELQFQKATLASYAVKYGFRTELTKEDLYNANLQRRVAAEILKEKGGYKHWLNCSKAIGLDHIVFR